MVNPVQQNWSAVRPRMRRVLSIWGWATLVACVAAALVVLQDALYGGLPSGVPLEIAIAQYTLPWLTWAALAPALLFLFAQYPIDLGRPLRGLSAYLALGVFAVGIKLVASALPAAILIWQPLGVSWGDGLRWLFANRAAANLLMFWLFVGGFTAYRYYRAASAWAHLPALPTALDRLPVRAGEGTAFVPVAEISFIEAERNQLVVHGPNGRNTLRGTLHELEARLPSGRFLRIHRSHIINIDHVTRIEPWGRGDYVVVMSDGSRLLSGKTYRETIRALLDVARA